MSLTTTLLSAALFGAFSVSDPGDDEARIAALLRGLEASWRAGDLEAVAEQAPAVVEAIQASACPVRRDAAIAAFMGAVAGSVETSEVPPRYLFWVAAQIDAQLEIFPRNVSRTAQGLRSEPGRSVVMDTYFLDTPYRDIPRQAGGCAPSVLSADVLNVSQPAAPGVFLVIERDEHRRSRLRDAEFLYGYPADEAGQVMARLREASSGRSWGWGTQALVFVPCHTIEVGEFNYARICRPGAE